MGEKEIATKLFCTRSSFTKTIFQASVWAQVRPALTAALCLGAMFCGGTGMSWAAGGGDKSVMSSLEQRLFFKSYDSDSEEARVSRLEKQVFGEPAQGDIHDRLEKLLSATATQQNPDGSVSGLNSQPAPQVTPQQPQQPQQTREQQEAEERDAQMQRAQVAAQAQKEQQENDMLQQGVSLWRAKKGREAMDKFTQVLQMDPGNAEANFSMGIAYESLNNLPEALSCYKRASQSRPGNKDYSDAIAAVERKLKTKIGIDDKNGALGQLATDASAAYKRGEYISALQMYKELDQKAPNQALVKYNIGTLYLATKNPIFALPYFKEALRLKPTEPRYAQAVAELQKNLDAAQQQHIQTESSYAAAEATGGGQQIYQNNSGWQAPPQGANFVQPATNYNQAVPSQKPPKPPKEKKQKPPKQPPPPALPTPTATDAMATMGLIGKSGKDGVQILEIGIASRASKAGLLKGDIIKAVNGTIVTHTKQINDILTHTTPGAPVQLTVQRNQQMGQVSL
ncbi:MAG TPA: tetratricopeptide repeat protein [Planktothrix sp.]|jgi:tetratricopeptide (TPR) repeat protein